MFTHFEHVRVHPSDWVARLGLSGRRSAPASESTDFDPISSRAIGWHPIDAHPSRDGAPATLARSEDRPAN